MNSPEAYIQFTPGLITDDGVITNELTEKFLKKFIDEFAGFIDRVYMSLPRPT